MRTITTRTAIGAALAALAAATIVVSAPAPVGAGVGTAPLTVLHGIGPAPSTVDVYLGETDASSWDLAIEGLSYGESVDAGAIPAGGYNVLLCTAAVAPGASVTSCADNGASAVNGNSGSNVSLAAGVPEVWIAAYGDPGFGRPVVLEVEPELGCVTTPEMARAQAVHAATAPPVNVLAVGTVVIADLAHGETDALDVPTGPYDVEVELTDGTPVLAVDGFTPPARQNTMVVVVGNPQFDADYDLVTVDFPLEVCPQPTTTTTAAPPPPQTQPRFTG